MESFSAVVEESDGGASRSWEGQQVEKRCKPPAIPTAPSIIPADAQSGREGVRERERESERECLSVCLSTLTHELEKRSEQGTGEEAGFTFTPTDGNGPVSLTPPSPPQGRLMQFSWKDVMD